MSAVSFAAQTVRSLIGTELGLSDRFVQFFEKLLWRDASLARIANGQCSQGV
ncbi:hypothetical protein D3C76_945510 [compost metagenome]